MGLRRSCAILVFAATQGAHRGALADDETDLEGLLGETILTTASKSAETSSSAPGTSTILTADDIHRYGIHSLAEAINFLSLGAITFDPLNTVDIGTRGVIIEADHGNHVLLLVNGHVMNEQLSGTARFDRGVGVPIDLVDHIEIILGPGAVLYGSNAMLGVINVVTKNARTLDGLHIGGDAELGKSTRIGGSLGTTFNLFRAPTEVTLGLDYYNQSGPSFTFPNQSVGFRDPYTGLPFQTQRGGSNVGYWGGTARESYYSDVPAGHLRVVSGPFELNVHASAFTHAAPYSSTVVNRNADFDEPNNRSIDRWLWVDLKHRATLSSVLQIDTRLYADSYDNRTTFNQSSAFYCRTPGVTTCENRQIGASRWAGIEVQSSFDWLQTGRLVTLAGFDARLRDMHAKQDVLDFDSGAYLRPSVGVLSASDAILGLFVQQTWQPADRVSFNGGARFDFDSQFDPVLSPRLAASVNLWAGGTFKALYSEAFRAPSWYETSVTTPTLLPAVGLRPETVRSVEASLEQRFGTQRIMMGLFRSWFRDLVELQVEEDSTQALMLRYRNVSQIDNFGFNGSYEGTLLPGSALRYGVNLTGAMARRNESGMPGEPLEIAPQFFGNARLLYDLPDDWPVLAVVSQFKTKALSDRSAEGEGNWVPKPTAPAQVELRATVSGPVPKWKGLSYRVSADYAFADRTPYVSGIDQAYVPVFPDTAHWQLVPVDTFRVTAGFQFDSSP